MITNDSLRIPPHSEEAERGILGSILLDSDAIHKCQRKGISNESFYDRRHQCLYENLLEMSQTNVPMDAITIGDWLKDHNAFEKIGGYDYLIELQGETLVPDHVDFYCDIVIDKKEQRTIIEKSSEAIDRAYRGDPENDEIISDLTTGLVGMRKREIKETTTDEIIELVQAAATGSTRCIPTPFDGLTRRTGGPMLGMETILTGRAKSGKSMLKSFWLRYLGEKGIPALDCPYEDGEIIAKMRCASIGTFNAGQMIRGGRYVRYNERWEWFPNQPRDIEVVRRKMKEMEQLPIYWDEERVRVKRLKSKLAEWVDKHGIKVVFLDGAKDIPRDEGTYNDTGQDEEISHGITEAARSLDIAIISIYHLTKLAQDELIKSHHIRGSGNIVSNSRLVYALQGDKSGSSLHSYSDAKPLDFNADGYCETRVLECIDNNHGDLGKTWLNSDLGLCAFSLK